MKCGQPSTGARCEQCNREHSACNQARRASLLAAGLCENCGKRPRLFEKRRCEECNDKKRAKDRERYALDHERQAAQRARAKRHREERIANGLCYRCGDDKLVPGLKICAECQEKQQVRERIRRAHARTKRELEAKEAAYRAVLAERERRRRAQEGDID